MTSIMFLVGGGGGGGLGNASILRMARLLRLSRMARMARLFRAMPELLILIKGMMQAMRSVLFTLCLLGIIIYVFGIAFRQLVGNSALDPSGEPYFGTIFTSMHTLLIDGTLMDGTGSVIKALGDQSYFYAGMFYLFILLAALTVMNMLIGVLCEVVSAVAATERETLTVSFVKQQLQKVMQDGGLDRDGDGTISKEEFSKILEFPDACRALEEVGVDVLNLVDNIDFIFVEEEGPDGTVEEKALSFGDFMDLVLTLRGSNTATVKDIVDLRKYVKECTQSLKEEVKRSRKPEKAERLAPSKDGGGNSECSHGRPARLHVSNGCSASTCDAAVKVCPAKSTGAVMDSPPSPMSPCIPSPPNGVACWQPMGCRPEESEMWMQRARLVDTLVSAQAELQRFVEILPPCEALEEDSNLSLLPGLPMHRSEEARHMNGIRDAAARKTPIVLLEPLRVRWLPGELSELQNQLSGLQQALTGGLRGLQRVRERFSPAPRLYDDGPRSPLMKGNLLF